MAPSDARRSFLLGMTLNELAFLMFFLLMLLSTTALHKKNKQLQQETQKNNELQLEITQTKENFDTSFKRLQLLEQKFYQSTGLASNSSPEQWDQAFEKLEAVHNNNQLASENIRLKQQLQQTQQLRIQLQQINPDAPPQEVLAKLIESTQNAQHDQQNLRGQLHYLQQQLSGNGLDHPPCWADANTGAIQYLYRISLYGQMLHIEAAWPNSRQRDVKSIPGASELAGQALSFQAFSAQTDSVYQWSKARECRHFVRIHDDPQTTKRSFKNALLTIESVFYKYLEH
ncbi:MAG: hypothetical protein CVV13_03945 [Gammaproteobacteria bacterium HGW-Gammaproteobacteria-3]|nr:MAG: hypothetical protein CVV13_03945 [Gammaproteobacteria bacterium HGW-Gammaproteobacteria-3]